MSAPMPFNPRDDQPLKEFADLHQQIVGLPLHLRRKLLPLCEKVGQFIHLQNKLIKIAQEAVDDLLLDSKYLQFDLEATRRKKEQLQELQDDREDYN